MNTNYIRTPIGLEAAVAAVQKSLKQAHIYRRCGLKPPHYIINLDGGNGQTTLTEYIAETFANSGVRHFGGLDTFLEYTLDGSMEQLKKVFADIRSCAVYTNVYEGVIAMDISKLSNHINETQVNVFIDEISKISCYATFIFYIQSKISRNTANLLSKIHEVLDEVEIIDVSPYSSEELAEITKRMIVDSGVMIEDDERVNKLLLEAVLAEEVDTVKMAKKLSQTMIRNSNFNGFIPTLSVVDIESVFQNRSTKKEAK